MILNNYLTRCRTYPDRRLGQSAIIIIMIVIMIIIMIIIMIGKTIINHEANLSLSLYIYIYLILYIQYTNTVLIS